MASIQVRTRNKKKYYYIVESRRINGKPRPVVIGYIGSIEKLLELLQGKRNPKKIKSYSHGSIIAFLKIAEKLQIVPIINKYICSNRKGWNKKPIRNGLTAGITIVLAAIGRACEPTSKRGWWEWAKDTSFEHLLRVSLAKVDSQHFWDLMDCLPENAIEKIEEEILQNVLKYYPLNEDTLFYDTTNFFTFINSQNENCNIAKRGKNKQKRDDLRQIGMALVVTQNDHIPLLHHVYEGNSSDSEVFRKLVFSIKNRMKKLNIDINKHTLVFDRGCNSKKNLRHIKRLKLHYVAALTPYHHKELIKEAQNNFKKIKIKTNNINIYRTKKIIWDQERTVLVFISEKLKLGQIQGVYQTLEKKKKQLRKIQRSLSNPKTKKRTKESLEKLLDKVLKGQFMDGLISYKLTSIKEGKWQLSYRTEKTKLKKLEDQLGFRILMTNRYEWDNKKIIEAFNGQSNVEDSFKQVKNSYHLAIRPSFHWTDQKLKVHFFLCIIGYLIAAIIFHESKKAGFKGNLNSLLEILNKIRLTTTIDISGKKGRPRCNYLLEEMTMEQNQIFKFLKLENLHLKKIKIKGVGVYN